MSQIWIQKVVFENLKDKICQESKIFSLTQIFALQIFLILTMLLLFQNYTYTAVKSLWSRAIWVGINIFFHEFLVLPFIWHLQNKRAVFFNNSLTYFVIVLLGY